ncbi:IS21-like element helper ATPase IstB [Methanoregula sp.]|jgi:DNA replication protein DnaC|uniref:IS21-like element helper ATPase IstB n=1 Tax=Methanoregula sp. TaxID=2052170 RepID=UPI003BB14F31
MIESLARQLKLPLLAGFEQHISKEDDFTGNLLHLLQLEVLDKERRGIERRTKTAGFPYIRVLDAFEFATKHLPKLNRDQVYQLAECRYITEKRNVIAVGNSGTGKTFLAIALGLEAIRRGFTVHFRKVSDLVNQMTEAQNEGRLSRYIKSLNNCQLLICDELGYLHYDLQGASLLFQVFAARDEVASTLVTSNLEFSKWPAFLGNDQTMCTALVDRLIHRAEILNMNGQSFRLRGARGDAGAADKRGDPDRIE